MRSLASFFCMILLIILALGPASLSATESESADFTYSRSGLSRDMSPDVGDADLRELVSGNTDFAFDLYHAISDEAENLFYSPYSISVALAMTYAGARGNTEAQMRDVLHFTLAQESLHPALNALDLEIASRRDQVSASGGDSFRLNIVNSIWGQNEYEFLQEFLDLLSLNYGAGMRLLDFVGNAEGCRNTINRWVEEQTQNRVQELIPEGVIDQLTRLVLVNAIYFKASWVHAFEEAATRDGDFRLIDGGAVTVPMMEQTESFRFAEGDGWQAVELPYVGDAVSMVIMLPEAGRFEEFENDLDAESAAAAINALASATVHLTMPKFEYDCGFSLKETLYRMGMSDAFIMGAADFSGMDGTLNLYIYEVVHKAFVSVDEQGTEAAAATAVIMAERGLPGAVEAIEFKVDRPFIFLICDIPTGSILFIGRVMNPST